MEPANSFIYALEDLRRYIRKVYGKIIKFVDVNDADNFDSDNELYGRYFKGVFANMGTDDVVIMMHLRGYTYLNYPHLDIEICFTPAKMYACSRNLIMTGECDGVDLKEMFPNVTFSVNLHKKESAYVSLVQYNLANPRVACIGVGPFPCQ